MSAEEVLELIRNEFSGKENSADLIDAVLDLLPGGFGANVLHVSGKCEMLKAVVGIWFEIRG